MPSTAEEECTRGCVYLLFAAVTGCAHEGRRVVHLQVELMCQQLEGALKPNGMCTPMFKYRSRIPTHSGPQSSHDMRCLA